MNENELRPFHDRANWIASQARHEINTFRAQIENVQKPPHPRLVPDHARGRQELGPAERDRIKVIEQRIEDVKDRTGKEITRVVDALPPHATLDDKRQVAHTANAILEGHVPPLQKNPIDYKDKGALSLDFNLHSGNRGGGDPNPGRSGPDGGNNPPSGGGHPKGPDDKGPPPGGGGAAATLPEPENKNTGAPPPSRFAPNFVPRPPDTPLPPASGDARASRFVEGLRGQQEGQKDARLPEQGKEQSRSTYSRFLQREVPTITPDKADAGTNKEQSNKEDQDKGEVQTESRASRFMQSFHGAKSASLEQDKDAKQQERPSASRFLQSRQQEETNRDSSPAKDNTKDTPPDRRESGRDDR